MSPQEKKQIEIYSERSSQFISESWLMNPLSIGHHLRKAQMDTIKPFRGMKILEVGCQDGSHLRYLREKNPLFCEADLYGLDQVMVGLINARFNSPEINFVHGSGYDLPFADAQFDLILLTGVLEHLHYPEICIQETFRVLKPGGSFLAYYSVKDYGICYQWLTNDILKNKDCIYSSTEAIGHDFTNVIKSASTYISAFEKSGLVVVHEKRVQQFFAPLMDRILMIVGGMSWLRKIIKSILNVIKTGGSSSSTHARAEINMKEFGGKDESKVPRSPRAHLAALSALVRSLLVFYYLDQLVFGKKAGVCVLTGGFKPK